MPGWKHNLLEDDAGIRAELERVKTIAVIGFKNDASGAAFRIPAYMHTRSCRVIAVNPKLAGSIQLGETAVATLADIREPVDLIDVFRSGENVPAHAEEALAMKPRPALFWMQLGVRNDAAAERLARAGIRVVQDRCLMVEHRRLIGPP